MAVLKLGSQAAADELYLAMNGRAFNDLEGDVCWLLFVKEVEFLRAPTQSSTALSAAGTNALLLLHNLYLWNFLRIVSNLDYSFYFYFQ